MVDLTVVIGWSKSLHGSLGRSFEDLKACFSGNEDLAGTSALTDAVPAKALQFDVESET